MALIPFSSYLIADLGVSMGDEGKGRVVCELIHEIQASGQQVGGVLKVNGGANSGHTVAGLKLNLLPGGVAEKSVKNLFIGSGVVADPRKFFWEGKPLEASGVDVFSRLKIDERCLFSDLTHRLLDLAFEHYRSQILQETPRGTTGRGISPAFVEENQQFQIYYLDFLKEKDIFLKKFKQRIERNLNIIRYVCKVDQETWFSFFEHLSCIEQRANKIAIDNEIFSLQEFDFKKFLGSTAFALDEDLLFETYWEAGMRLASCIQDVRELILDCLHQKEYVVGEFGQSYWLDKRHGFTPNVTASHTFTPEFFQSANIPLQPIHTVACAKAYDTKVGTHLFLTQMPQDHPLAKRLSKLEFGTSTGRQRMVGWFDAVEKADALRYGGYQDLIINKLDVLSYGEDFTCGPLRIAVAYRKKDGSILYYVPRDDAVRKDLTPIYLDLPSWEEVIDNCRTFEDLPDKAKTYVAHLLHSIVYAATRANTKPLGQALPNIRYIGVGPEPDQIIKDVPSLGELEKWIVPYRIA